MLGYLGGFALLLVCVALQGAWPPWLRICGQPPNMVVAAVACIGLVKGARDGCLAGLVSAVLVAGAEQTPLGGLCVGFMVVGAGAGLLRGSLFAEHWSWEYIGWVESRDPIQLVGVLQEINVTFSAARSARL